VTADASQLATFGTQLLGGPARLQARGLVRRHGQLLLTAIKRNASAPRSSPPGSQPRLQTGDYVRSWNLAMSGNASVSVATAGTAKPQARRLEFGFVGEDSRGRHYADPPRPHAGPALDVIAPAFGSALADLAARSLGDL
jgi:hypothetical protein